MERRIILKNTVTGEVLTLPVTPERYPAASGRTVERLDMAVTGQIAVPGLKTLMAEELEFMLPARSYPFLTPGARTDPPYYLERLKTWSENANVCRYIVVGAAVNLPVLLGPLSFREEDGSNDVYVKLPLYEYRYLDEARTEQPQTETQPDTENYDRSVDPADEPDTAGAYTVVSGDCLWNICREFYGDGTLWTKLAAYNGVPGSGLIFPGDVLQIPARSVLDGTTPVTSTQKSSSDRNEMSYFAEMLDKYDGDIHRRGS